MWYSAGTLKPELSKGELVLVKIIESREDVFGRTVIHSAFDESNCTGRMSFDLEKTYLGYTSGKSIKGNFGFDSLVLFEEGKYVDLDDRIDQKTNLKEMVLQTQDIIRVNIERFSDSADLKLKLGRTGLFDSEISKLLLRREAGSRKDREIYIFSGDSNELVKYVISSSKYPPWTYKMLEHLKLPIPDELKITLEQEARVGVIKVFDLYMQRDSSGKEKANKELQALFNDLKRNPSLPSLKEVDSSYGVNIIVPKFLETVEKHLEKIKTPEKSKVTT